MSYKYRDEFNVKFCTIFSNIVFYHLRSNKIKFSECVKLLNTNDVRVTYLGFKAALNNNNMAAFNFIYWVRIFEVLQIDINSIDVIELYQIAKAYNIEYLKQYHSKRKKKL
jgi:hypothetical protein